MQTPFHHANAIGSGGSIKPQESEGQLAQGWHSSWHSSRETRVSVSTPPSFSWQPSLENASETSGCFACVFCFFPLWVDVESEVQRMPREWVAKADFKPKPACAPGPQQRLWAGGGGWRGREGGRDGLGGRLWEDWAATSHAGNDRTLFLLWSVIRGSQLPDQR